VNGRALVNGLQLASMELSDMLDVLHYFFEDDINFSTAEQADAREKTRSSIYEDLYGSSYKYGSNKSVADMAYGDTPSTQDFDAPRDEVQPFNPAVKPKPYKAPTKFDPDSAVPFGSALDAPLEH
jgi:hypothetical protein